MNRRPNPIRLGIECGGTRTVALLADAQDNLVLRVEAGPANLRLITDTDLAQLFSQIAGQIPCPPEAVGIGIAGLRTRQDYQRVFAAAQSTWPSAPLQIGSDLDSALAAAAPNPAAAAHIIILSGTGSCCYGRSARGDTAKVGGWGHLLGDKASGYDIGLRALKAVLHEFDRSGHWPALGRQFLSRLLLNEPNDLIDWIQRAQKSDVASLAFDVFDVWQNKDKIAQAIIRSAAETLAHDAVACARRLTSPNRLVQFHFSGGVCLSQPKFQELIAARIRQARPKSEATALRRESAWGAVEMAKCAPTRPDARASPPSAAPTLPNSPLPSGPSPRTVQTVTPALVPTSSALSPTEQRLEESMGLDQMPLPEAIRLMLSQDAKIPRALLSQIDQLERAVQWIVRAFKNDRRLWYVGAGTSGRLGVLDASECPPTFSVPPTQVQGIIAGGLPALWRSIEGAEDDLEAGARAAALRGVAQSDVVVGIAASGRTPFVWGALGEAKRRQAKTILLCFNPYLQIPRDMRPGLVIAPNLGPEVLTGSTRLKAGTATKLILNIFTTLAMVKLGKVVSNLMVDLNPSNTKLRDRAVRILGDLTGADSASAKTALEQSGWVIKKAWRNLTARRHWLTTISGAKPIKP